MFLYNFLLGLWTVVFEWWGHCYKAAVDLTTVYRLAAHITEVILASNPTPSALIADRKHTDTEIWS